MSNLLLPGWPAEVTIPNCVTQTATRAPEREGQAAHSSARLLAELVEAREGDVVQIERLALVLAGVLEHLGLSVAEMLRGEFDGG